MALEGLQMPRLVEVETDTLTDTFGAFTMQPLERGFGVTVGHAIRRVLLSSVQGAAIDAVRGVVGARQEVRTRGTSPMELHPLVFHQRAHGATIGRVLHHVPGPKSSSCRR